MTDRLANTAAEREILGGILTDAGALHKASPILRQDDFYRQDYRFIYGLMAEMILRGDRPDVVTLVEEAKAKLADHWEDLLRIFRTITDINLVGKCYSIEEKAEIVAEYARRRRLVDKGRELAALAADMGQDVDTVAATISNDLQGMGSKAQKNTASMSAAIVEFMGTLERRRSGETLATGLTDLDALITGLEPGQLVTIAGRPGHGKTALAGTMAVNLAKQGKEVLVYSMEMGAGELAGRFLSRCGGIDGNILKRPGAMTAEQKKSLLAGVQKLEALPITICTQGSLTPGDVASISSRMKRTAGLDLIIIDYLQLMSSGRKSDAGSRVQEISYITRTLKGLANLLDVPIVMLSQLSRDNVKERRKPRLTDLRDSGSIEQDSNTILLLYREAEGGGLSDKTFVIVGKQRNGRTGECAILFNTNYGYFSNYDHSRDVPY